VYLPELRAAARDADLPDPDEAWEQFGRDIMARRPEEPQQQSTGRQPSYGVLQVELVGPVWRVPHLFSMCTLGGICLWGGRELLLYGM
jgi:hypothetical protein